MLVVILAIGLIMLITGIILLCQGTDYDKKIDGGIALTIFGVIATLVIIPVLIGIVILGTQSKIDSEIEMYQEENNKIETAIQIEIDKYIDHESDIYDKLDDADSATILLLAYPQIKSDTMVMKQIEILQENNNQIKSLKTKKINLVTWKFLIYFGH
ncbi:hypothetical protein [uncultured Clostridium sp.]|uniref:hypothetical protein n=1 Tax=uncultured Clostridium sp. TaxID=59620 RepID=UPI00262E9644|nr:hypothetical protein [uncultured Clostridium sp.]